MNLLETLRQRFTTALAPLVADPAPWVAMIRPSQDPRFGDYQANFAMPLAKQLGKTPPALAAEVVARLEIADLCDPPEVAGPGFINLRLRTDSLENLLAQALVDDRLGVAVTSKPRTYVIDYSGPNVAKPMHVGHIRSTVIGDALNHTLRWLGHRVISDNHLGDWGTQFGMILYGYRHFLDAPAYQARPVEELGRLYRLVRQLMDYQQTLVELPRQQSEAARLERVAADLAAQPASPDKAAQKEAAKQLRRAQTQAAEAKAAAAGLLAAKLKVENDAALFALAQQHPQIPAAVLAETAKLHEGDPDNLALWQTFLPFCRQEIDAIYRRLNVSFDETLGESFYHDRLADVVDDLTARGLAKQSEGATCIFLEGSLAPMLIRKQDGAFLYATTDLATIKYRVERWHPDAILYVVDHRQSLHFEQLFGVAKLWGYDQLELVHVSFGTVLGDDGKPFKTRSGDTVGLEGLLDEACRRALAIIQGNAGSRPTALLDPAEQQAVANTIGIGALKYADLSQNRTSDYTFSYDKMLAMEGNTATYMQYAYARVRSIFTKGEVAPESVREGSLKLSLPQERALGVALLQFSEALDMVAADYRPNHLTAYLFELANRYSTFFENCPVLKADSDEQRASRLKLCDLTARTIAQGLRLLGIGVVEKM